MFREASGNFLTKIKGEQKILMYTDFIEAALLANFKIVYVEQQVESTIFD